MVGGIEGNILADFLSGDIRVIQGLAVEVRIALRLADYIHIGPGPVGHIHRHTPLGMQDDPAGAVVKLSP